MAEEQPVGPDPDWDIASLSLLEDLSRRNSGYRPSFLISVWTVWRKFVGPWGLRYE